MNTIRRLDDARGDYDAAQRNVLYEVRRVLRVMGKLTEAEIDRVEGFTVEGITVCATTVTGLPIGDPFHVNLLDTSDHNIRVLLADLKFGEQLKSDQEEST